MTELTLPAERIAINVKFHPKNGDMQAVSPLSVNWGIFSLTSLRYTALISPSWRLACCSKRDWHGFGTSFESYIL